MSYKEYLSLAIPFIISTVTQPLLGAVDTAVVGQLEDPSYIGGVAIGTVIFNTLYWLFGFLRVSTSGFSAQSLGSKEEKDIYYAYFRPLAIAIIISLIFVVSQGIIRNAAILVYQPDPKVLKHATTYFNTLIWGAPFVLVGYVNLGWLMGRKYIKETLFLQISSNVINILLDFAFVVFLKMGVGGVAYATLISQTYGFILGSYMVFSKISFSRIIEYLDTLFDRSALKKILMVNSDLMIRTICLLVMTNMFMSKSSQLGTGILAANSVLYQIQYIISYIFDGLANASSIYSGKCLGEKNLSEYKRLIHISTISLGVTALVLSILVLIFKNPMIEIFTDLDTVISLSRKYALWLVVFPPVISIGLVYYGFFTGSTYTRPVRNSMIISLVAFVLAYFLLVPKYGNHGLWFSFILFSLSRSLTLLIYKNQLLREVFAPYRNSSMKEAVD